ncbi:hypothetical protein [Bdellovibrio sp. HCB288]|uniref:hypothetical protein n=1 Tax=Bdellovibrio sp. HCB288 TaxID=3394355 RepID=UPI0039B619A9
MNFSYRLIYTTGAKTAQEIGYVNKCYHLWASEFGADLASRGAKLNHDEFQRARVIAVVLKDDEVAGFHLYSPFDLRESSSLDHSYVRAMSEEAKTKLLEKNINSFLAMEYLTVAPGFRTKEAGGPKVAELIVRLGLKVMNELNLEGALGIARMDRKVNFLGDLIGFTEIAQISKYNNLCSVMVMSKYETPREADDFTKKTVETLWGGMPQTSKIAA